MLIQCVTVENYSDKSQWLKDLQLPGSRVKLEPGATFQVSYGVWLRARRRFGSWLRKVGDGRGMAHAVLHPNPPVAPEQKAEVTTAALVQSTPTGPGTTNPATVPQTTKKPLEEFSMAEVKERAARLGISYKVGMSKAALIQAIREKRTATKQEATN